MTIPPIGIMQGRLVPKEEGRFQSFPAKRWRDEFAFGREAGIACIEWIYEEPHEDENPMRTDEGQAEMKRLSAETGVSVWSICADYYMTKRLVRPDATADGEAVAHLSWLISRAGRFGITYIVLPFVDSSSLKTEAEREALPRILSGVLRDAKAAGVELHLETDLAPRDFAALLERAGHTHLKANYDIGNSAGMGFNQKEELAILAPWLGSVHVKDRVKGGGTVPLGTGNADLPGCFDKIRDAHFSRWFILQVARGDEGDEIAWIRHNRQFVEAQVARAAAG
jgi:hexulose-6-phosphate isomerase